MTGLHDTDTVPRCRMGARCTDPYLDPDRGRVGSAVLGPGGVCVADASLGRAVVAALPSRVDELAAAIVEPMRKPGTVRDPDMPRATWRERDSPLDLRADAMMRETTHELAQWAQHVDLSRHPGASGFVGHRWAAEAFAGSVTGRARAAAAHLAAHWDLLLGLPAMRYLAHGTTPLHPDTVAEVEPGPGGMWTLRDGGSAVCVFLAQTHRIDHFLGYTAKPTRHPDPCCHPDCGAPGMVVERVLEAGQPSVIRCEQCGRDIPETTWRWWTGEVLANPWAYSYEQLEAALYTGIVPTTGAAA